MKRIITILSFVLCGVISYAQSTNPLNYSGRMFVSSYEVLSTPRYVSYEDHGILSSDVTIPVTEVTTFLSDFENGTIRSGEDEYKIKVTATKKYTLTDGTWVVVIYMQTIDGTKHFEYIWREYGHPYLDTIIKNDDGTYKIIRLNLSSKPHAASPDEALIQMLGSYGNF